MDDEWEEVIYLDTVRGAEIPVVCIDLDNEWKFNKGWECSTKMWKCMKPLEKQKRKKEIKEEEVTITLTKKQYKEVRKIFKI